MNAVPQKDTVLAPAPSPVLVQASYFGIGLLFAAGLAISGMTQPAKVVGFLDFTGDWDPSLGFVMGGAIAVHLALYKWIVKRPSPLMGLRFGIPTRTDINLRLIGGAALFGAGWAIGGLCPGPGLVGAGAFGLNALLFVGAMLGGMQLFHVANNWWEART